MLPTASEPTEIKSFRVFTLALNLLSIVNFSVRFDVLIWVGLFETFNDVFRKELPPSSRNLNVCPDSDFRPFFDCGLKRDLLSCDVCVSMKDFGE